MNEKTSILLELCKDLPEEFQKNLPASILNEENLEKVEKKLKVSKILLDKEKDSKPEEIIQKIFGFKKIQSEKSIFEEINKKVEKIKQEPSKEKV